MKHFCNTPGCSELVETSRCPKHAGQIERVRGSASKRGYDKNWREVRYAWLTEHPFCEDCEKAGKLVIATDVHHKIKGMARKHRHELLASLCHACHSRRTMAGE